MPGPVLRAEEAVRTDETSVFTAWSDRPHPPQGTLWAKPRGFWTSQTGQA